jgi:hypothetical protein
LLVAKILQIPLRLGPANREQLPLNLENIALEIKNKNKLDLDTMDLIPSIGN